MSVVEKFKYFKVVNSQMKASLASQMNIGIGFFDNETNINSKSMALIIDAIAYRELDVKPEEVNVGDDYVRKYKVKGCGIRINLKYKSFSGETNTSITQLNAALKLGLTNVEIAIEAPGLGQEGLSLIIGGQIEDGEVRSLDRFEETVEIIYSNLVNHIKTNQDTIHEEEIEIFLIGNDSNNYFNTQSILFGLKNIMSGNSLIKAIEENNESYDEQMIRYIYNTIMVGRKDTDSPSEIEMKKAKDWRYLN